MKKYKKLMWFLLFTFLSIFLIILLLMDKTTFLDNSIYQFSQLFKANFTTTFFKVITNFSSSLILIVLSLFILLISILKKKKEVGIAVILNLIFEVLLNVFLKSIFARTRPLDLMIIEELGFSFPSGHAMASMAFYGFLIYLLYKSEFNKPIKRSGIALLVFLIVLIGFSRIYLGVHFASDVLAGFMISLSYLMITTSLYNYYINYGKYTITRKIFTNNVLSKDFFGKSFYYASQGIISCIKKEKNLRIHVTIMIIVIILGFLLSINMTEWCICILLFIIVIALEMINTAIEISLDIYTDAINEKVKLAKDISAGAVLVSAIGAIIIGICIFLPKIIGLWIEV